MVEMETGEMSHVKNGRSLKSVIDLHSEGQLTATMLVSNHLET